MAKEKISCMQVLLFVEQQMRTTLNEVQQKLSAQTGCSQPIKNLDFYLRKNLLNKMRDTDENGNPKEYLVLGVRAIRLLSKHQEAATRLYAS